jgi:hypothetical protein
LIFNCGSGALNFEKFYTDESYFFNFVYIFNAFAMEAKEPLFDYISSHVSHQVINNAPGTKSSGCSIADFRS